MTMNLLRMLENHGLMDMSRNSNFMDKSFMDSKNLMDSMAKSANLGNFVDLSKGGASGFVDLTKGYQPSRFDNDSLNWARTMLQAQAQMQAEAQAHQAQAHAHAQAQSVKSSAGHSMTSAHGQNGNSGGPPSMVSRIPDLPCTPNPNSYATSPTSLHNSQLVVPHPLKPMNKKKSYQCKMCDQMYDCKSELMLHTQQIHKQDPKPYKCPTCNKSFANSSYLSQHNRIHAGIKPYQCNFCERKFTQLSHLQQHRRTHTGEKPYKCQAPNCGKAFTQLSNLQTHSRSHMTDKPFRCNSCYKCFSDEMGLREHIPKHSDTKHLKTHICRICGKSYTQETYLARHMAKHSMDGGGSRLRIGGPRDTPLVLQRAMKSEPGMPLGENCCTPRSPDINKGSSAFIPISYSQPVRSQTQFPFPPSLQNASALSSQLPHISCVTSPGYFPSYDPMSGHRNDSLDREMQTRDNSSMIARSLLSLQHIKSFSTTFAQCNSGST